MNKALTKLIGLSNHEYEIWQALKLKPNTISSLARLTGFPRTTLYTAIAKMLERGLINKHQKGRSVLLSPISDIELSQILSGRNFAISSGKDTQDLDMEVASHMGNGFKIIRGKSEMLKVWQKSTEKETRRVYVIQSTQSLVTTVKKFKAGEFIPINDAIKKNGVIMSAILRNDNLPTYLDMHKNDPRLQEDILRSFLGRTSDVTLVQNEFLNMNSELVILNKSAFLMNWEDEVAIEIENADMIKLLKELFELTKGYGKKIKYEEYIQNYIRKIKPSI